MLDDVVSLEIDRDRLLNNRSISEKWHIAGTHTMEVVCSLFDNACCLMARNSGIFLTAFCNMTRFTLSGKCSDGFIIASYFLF